MRIVVRLEGEDAERFTRLHARMLARSQGEAMSRADVVREMLRMVEHGYQSLHARQTEKP